MNRFSFRFGVQGPGFGVVVSGFGVRVSGFRDRVSGFGVRVSGFGVRGSGSGLRGRTLASNNPNREAYVRSDWRPPLIQDAGSMGTTALRAPRVSWRHRAAVGWIGRRLAG